MSDRTLCKDNRPVFGMKREAIVVGISRRLCNEYLTSTQSRSRPTIDVRKAERFRQSIPVVQTPSRCLDVKSASPSLDAIWLFPLSLRSPAFVLVLQLCLRSVASITHNGRAAI
jgi:hypothetical protein